MVVKKTTGERLAVLETENKRQSDDTEKILREIKNISAFIYEYGPKIDILEEEHLNDRLTKVETRQKIYISIAASLFTLCAGAALLGQKLMAFIGL